jgi:Tfp pilus assembly protein PilF
LQFEHNAGNEENDKKKQNLLLSGHLNEAVCYLKLNEPLEAIKHCALALKQDPNSVKALYRRATVGPVLCVQLNVIGLCTHRLIT